MACVRARNEGWRRRAIVCLWKSNSKLKRQTGKNKPSTERVHILQWDIKYLSTSKFWRRGTCQLHSYFHHDPSIHKQLSRECELCYCGNKFTEGGHIPGSRQVSPHMNSQTLHTITIQRRTAMISTRQVSVVNQNNSVHSNVLYSLLPSCSYCLMCKCLHLLPNYLTKHRWVKYDFHRFTSR